MFQFAALVAFTLAQVEAPETSPLLFTRQSFLVGDEPLQFEEGKVVRVNVLLSRSENLIRFEELLATAFKGKTRPALTVAVGVLPDAKAWAAYDAVIALPSDANPKRVRRDGKGGILPPGTRIFVSGQAEKAENLADATRLTLEGLRKTLSTLNLDDDSIVQLRAFFKPMHQVDVVQQEVARFFGSRTPPPIVYVEWKNNLPIEIELVAWGGRERAGHPVDYLATNDLKASPVFSRIARVNYGPLIFLDGFHAQKPGTPEEEVVDVFEQVAKKLDAANSDFKHLVKATYYVKDDETTKAMGQLRPRWYDPKKPPAASMATVDGTGKPGQHVTLDLIAVPSATRNINAYGPQETGDGFDEKLIAKRTDYTWKPLFNGKDMAGWKRIDNPRLPMNAKPIWRVEEGGVLRCIGGPGALEYQKEQFGDFILRLEVRTRLRYANGGVFFRAIPGDFMNGYEAQIYNRAIDGDVTKPWVWATGAIDDRENTRKLISRDGEWFHYTIMAMGARISTYVNGYPTVDFHDTRDLNDNPRRGLRLDPGVIQLQAHDEGTDIEFRNIRIGTRK